MCWRSRGRCDPNVCISLHTLVLLDAVLLIPLTLFVAGDDIEEDNGSTDFKLDELEEGGFATAWFNEAVRRRLPSITHVQMRPSELCGAQWALPMQSSRE